MNQLVMHGNLRAHFDTNGKIEFLDLMTNAHSEYISRAQLRAQSESPDQKQSPKVNKSLGKRSQQRQQQPQVQSTMALPESPVNEWGVTSSVMQFLEVWSKSRLRPVLELMLWTL